MDVAEFREKLRTDLAETEQTLASIRDRLTVPQLDSGGEIGLTDQHPADAASETESRELDLTRQRMLEVRLDRARQALARIEDGTYGKCVACGEQIPRERLEAVPETPYCVRDAAREEHR
jgi:RNA polymerase-binding transcription factor DksA